MYKPPYLGCILKERQHYRTIVKENNRTEGGLKGRRRKGKKSEKERPRGRISREKSVVSFPLGSPDLGKAWSSTYYI